MPCIIYQHFILVSSCSGFERPLWLNFSAFHVFFLSSKQNLLLELDGIQSDFTALKLKNEELKVSYQDASQEVCQT